MLVSFGELSLRYMFKLQSIINRNLAPRCTCNCGVIVGWESKDLGLVRYARGRAVTGAALDRAGSAPRLRCSIRLHDLLHLGRMCTLFDLFLLLESNVQK